MILSDAYIISAKLAAVKNAPKPEFTIIRLIPMIKISADIKKNSLSFSLIALNTLKLFTSRRH